MQAAIPDGSGKWHVLQFFESNTTFTPYIRSSVVAISAKDDELKINILFRQKSISRISEIADLVNVCLFLWYSTFSPGFNKVASVLLETLTLPSASSVVTE